MKRIGQALESLSHWLSALGRLVLLGTMLHVTLDVILRFVINQPLAGTVEISAYWSMVALVFLPLAAVECRNGHIAVEIVAQHLGERAQRLLIGVVCLASALFYALLAWRTGHEAIEKMRIGEKYSSAMELPIWPPRFLLPLGCGLLVLVLVVKAARLLGGDDEPLRAAGLDEALDSPGER
jgi:TRAP-type C4-dicarboxylate transport system permease small subunit